MGRASCGLNCHLCRTSANPAARQRKSSFRATQNDWESDGNTKTVILTAWEDPDAHKRQAAIEQTKWRLQKLGGLVERLRKMSKRWRCQRAVLPLQLSAITLPA